MRHPSPQQWDTVLAQARYHRTPRLWPPAAEDDPTAGLVRAYAPPLEECMRVPAPAGEAR
ncbi:hypothetical protein [Streptomyces sp. NPDC002845]